MCRSSEFANVVANSWEGFAEDNGARSEHLSIYVVGEAPNGYPQSRSQYTNPRRGKCPIRILLTVCLGVMCTFLTYLNLPDSSDNLHQTEPRSRRVSSSRPVHQLQKRSGGVKVSTRSFWELLSSDVRLSQYCNTPPQIQLGQEGNIGFEKYDLVQVHVVLVPGQRPISQSTAGIPNPLYRCMLGEYSLKFPAVREFMESAIRYEETQHNKGAFKTFNIIPSKALCGTKHLLPEGFHQHISLGQNLNQAYRGKFESSVLRGDNSFKVHLLSHYLEASYESVMAFSHGLIGFLHLDDIVVHKSHDNFCHAQLLNGTCRCLKVETLKPFIDRAKKTGHFMFKPGHTSTDHIAQKLSIADVKSASILEISHNLLLRACQGIELQCRGSAENCLHKSLVRQLLLESDSYWQNLTTDPIFVSYSKLYSYPFLKKLVMEMQADDPRTSSDIFVYSADSYLPSHILASLGTTVFQVPSYANRLVFELYSRENRLGGANRFIRVLHDGFDVTGRLEMCRDQLVDGLCKFKFFRDYLELDLLKENSYGKACTS